MQEQDFLEIDAVQGEGGGQILRTSLALSVLLEKPVHIFNIRAGRQKPGLKAQHLAAVNAIASLSKASVKGNFLRSREIFFSPKEIVPETFVVNIGTAGSISLFLQQLFPVSLRHSLDFHIVGGTDVAFAPSTNFLENVFLPRLHAMGAKPDFKLVSRGFFPKGRGRVSFKSKEAKLPLKPVKCLAAENFSHFKCISTSSGLPAEVSKNQAIAAKKILLKKFPEAEFEERLESNPARKDTIGSAIDIFAVFEGTILGANALGEKSKPAEKVGFEAGQKLLQELEPNRPIDSHCADQLLLFMALAKNKSEISVSRFTEHCRTNIEIIEKFLPCKFSVEGDLDKPAIISVEGIGFR